MGIHTAHDSHLVREVVKADAEAWARLARRVADPVWTTCRLLCDDDTAKAAFAEVMAALRADDFRRLRPYDGSSRIETFVTLIARDVLAERLLGLFQSPAGHAGWTAFERLFGADLNRIIARRLPGPDREDIRRDAYQDICLALVADDHRRIRAYRGIGSFTGFVLHTVDRLLIDFIRRIPAQAALSLSDECDMASDRPSPEESLLDDEDQRLLAQAADALRRTAEALSAPEQLYLRIALGGAEPLPAREVARLMGRPVGEIYKLKQRVMSRLRTTLEQDPAVKMWRASV